MLAQMTRWEFEALLGQRHIARYYSKDDLLEDIEYARDRSRLLGLFWQGEGWESVAQADICISSPPSVEF
jgi:hypothetical protein